ncbi:hypothetical protein T12_7751 [Trichinella patagoniensis]|uniref:Uncharacterized protein n=1 Tax=Trichinella patagoniensis TaxID=990121 RepID=A0A0V0ZVK7_9BILA|nr:hypothetical protein T12_7751 [Trichinella patagoniensis]
MEYLRSVAMCTCCGSSGAVGRGNMASSVDIAADSWMRKGLSSCWYREPSGVKSCNPWTTVSTQVTWTNGGRWHESEAISAGLE